jgi:hypothetical protein
MQIDLMSDHLDDHLPPTPMGPINIDWSIAIARGDGKPDYVISYGSPTHFDWVSRKTVRQPIETVVLNLDSASGRAAFTPIIRP